MNFSLRTFSAVTFIIAMLAIIITGGVILEGDNSSQASGVVVVEPDFQTREAVATYGESAYHLEADCSVTEYSTESGRPVASYPQPSYLPTDSPVFYPMSDIAEDLGLECR